LPALAIRGLRLNSYRRLKFARSDNNAHRKCPAAPYPKLVHVFIHRISG